MAANERDYNEEVNASGAEGHMAPLEADKVYCSFNEPRIRYSGCSHSCSPYSTLGIS